MSEPGFTLPPSADAPPLEEFTAGIPGGLGAILPAPVIDLDKMRARRIEANRQPAAALRVGGKSYDLPPELPLGILDAFARLSLGDMGALAAALRLLWPDVEGPNPDLGKPLNDGTTAVDTRKTIILESPSTEIMYEHGLTLPEFNEVLSQVVAGYGIEGGLPPS